MIIEFLNSYEEELHNSRFKTSEDLEMVSTKILETEKMLKLIESENEDVFTEFTPRAISVKNADKMNELYEELKSLQEEKISLESTIRTIDDKLKDLKSAMKEISSFDEIVPTSSQNVSRETSSSGTVSKDSLHLVLSYLPQDPIRAKIELENLLK